MNSKFDPTKNIQQLRKNHNRDLIKRMRNGESLTSFDSQSSWFPPRPIIEKDQAAIEQLYGKTQKNRKTSKRNQTVRLQSV